MGMGNAKPTVESGLDVSYKVKRISVDPEIPLLDTHPRGTETSVHKRLALKGSELLSLQFVIVHPVLLSVNSRIDKNFSLKV